MKGPKKMLTVVVKESDMWHGSPLYVAFVHRLRTAGVAGVTAYAGIMGFGQHHHIHLKGLFGIADDRPVTVFAVDEEHTLRTAVAEAGDMLGGALVFLVDAEAL